MSWFENLMSDIWGIKSEYPKQSINNKKQNVEEKKITAKDQAILNTANVRPWVRYWARCLDMMIFGVVFGIFLSIFMPSVFEFKDSSDIRIVCLQVGILSLFIWIFIESILLSCLGTTPGKWLLKVHLRDEKNSNPKFFKVLKRSIAVWFSGLAAGIPIISIFTLIAAHKHLSKRGITSWDEDGHFTITHGKIGMIRIIVATGIIVGVILLNIE